MLASQHFCSGETGIVSRKLWKKGEKKKAVFSPTRYPGFCAQQEAGGALLSGKAQVSEPAWAGIPGENHLAPGVEHLAVPPRPHPCALAPPDKGQLVSWWLQDMEEQV